MLTPTGLLAAVARQHVDELVEQATRHRLATALRRGRRQLWPDSLPRTAAADPVSAPQNHVVRVGRLDPCEVRSVELAQGRAR